MLLQVLTIEGPIELVRRVWAEDEAAHPDSFRGKRYDDASVVLCCL